MTAEATTAPAAEAQKPAGEAGVEKEKKGFVAVEKNGSFLEESNHLSDLKDHEKKALAELRAKLEEAIVENKLFKKDGEENKEKEKVKEEEKGTEEAKEEEEEVKEEEKSKEEAKEEEEEVEKEEEEEVETEEKSEGEAKENQEEVKKEEEKEKEEEKSEEEAKEKEEEVKKEEVKEEEEKSNGEAMEIVDKDISLWGVPLLPSKGIESIDVVLLKFLRAREFKVKEAFEMLQKTLTWRKDSNIDSILDEELLGADLGATCYIDGTDREGHPVCYNVYGVFQDEELYRRSFGTEEQREKFLRWRVQLMEEGIKKLDFKPGGVASLLQITDLKNSPGLAKKELRTAMKRAVELLQDNYPEFVARNIFVNVPFWYYAIHAILSPFLTQRTRSKFVFARPASLTETLLKYIAAEDLPISYGGLKRQNDTEFSVQDSQVSEIIIKSKSTKVIEIPAPEAGTTLIWDLTVLGWDVIYKEEFVPYDEGAYTIIIHKDKKMGCQEAPIRNTFRNSDSGKVVLTIENTTSKRKKVLYRYKTTSS